MQQYSSIPEQNSHLNATSTLLSAIEQLSAELWLERSLNQLQSCLNDCLGSAFRSNNVRVTTEAAIFQTVVDELHSALNTTRVAIALIQPQENICRVCYVSNSSSQTQMLRTVMSDEGKKLRLKLQEIIKISDLQQLEHQEPQSAWLLSDNFGVNIGWLIIELPGLECNSSLKASQIQISQLINRAVKQCILALTQLQQTQYLQQKCQHLEAKNQELERTNQLKNQFLANTSHEIRTPLSSIIGFTHLLLAQGYDTTKERHQEYLNIIQSSSKHLLALINDIIDLSKIEADQLEVQWEIIDIPVLCRNILAIVKEKAANKGLKLHLNIDTRATSIVADSLRLKQMLLNLLFNALKFTNVGTVGLQVKSQGTFIHFTVWDTGTGISVEHQVELFQPYFQITNALVSRDEGTGLGLAVTRKLAELHGGRVEVESEVDHGSRFTIILPVEQEDSPSFKSGRSSKDREALSKENFSDCGFSISNSFSCSKDILLVEDDLYNAQLIQIYLEKLGYQVNWVKNATQMWKELGKQEPTVILLDIYLPDSSGIAVIQQLRKNNKYKRTTVIVQTAMAMKGDRETCLAAGANDYIPKPINLPLLASVVSKYSKQAT
ncbi:hybrid histidine kinase/response regulator HrmK [Iningainema tapete]|uniref:Circadian input-output histidine kinase CikA n=1 Tax=Iningainema tapete BLCC-T55 TaxID=2748662 RepID=A0A8J7BZQ3_9CYAN|nr:hybrid histidine kinase/response regulator HrmK [Iningainema tapete]MBD2778172.1 response regulator [Iningainema tapete BLCC-T55]